MSSKLLVEHKMLGYYLQLSLFLNKIPFECELALLVTLQGEIIWKAGEGTVLE